MFSAVLRASTACKRRPFRLKARAQQPRIFGKPSSDPAIAEKIFEQRRAQLKGPVDGVGEQAPAKAAIAGNNDVVAACLDVDVRNIVGIGMPDRSNVFIGAEGKDAAAQRLQREEGTDAHFGAQLGRLRCHRALFRAAFESPQIFLRRRVESCTQVELELRRGVQQCPAGRERSGPRHAARLRAA